MTTAPASPSRLRALVALLLASVIGASCTDATSPNEPGIDPQLLTPAAAALLDANGFFPRQQPRPGYVSPRSPASAARIADDFLAGGLSEEMRQSINSDRGELVDLAAIKRCGPPRFAESAYDVNDMTPAQPARQYFIGVYFFAYCSRAGEIIVTVAVPIEPSLLGGSDTSRFRATIARGVPLEIAGLPLLTAEVAARLAAARTGRRVAGVPELVLPRLFPGIDYARWLVPLESPVVVRGFITAEWDTLSAVMVGTDLDNSYGLEPRVLRPRQRATLTARLDTNETTLGGGIALNLFTARLGMPRGVEPFLVRTPP